MEYAENSSFESRERPHEHTSHLSLPPASVERELLKPSWPIRHVRTERQLTELIKKLDRAELFSVDTETWGPRVLSDKLCLIQISIPPSELKRTTASTVGETYLVDVVALEKLAASQPNGRNPLAPLKGSLEAGSKTKVIHHAQFERGQFIKYGIDLDGVVDTKNLAKALRPDMVSHSLQACVYEILGREMSKEEQTSKWIQRPLTQSQIDYAALDSEIVLHLLEKLRALERHTLPDRSWDLDAALKQLGDARRERAALFDTAGVKTTLDALDEIAARNRAALAETLQFEADRGVSANYRGAYGVAAYKRSPLEEVSFTKLEELVPSLAPLIVKETTTRRSLADALNDLGRGDELDDIWDEINVETGDRSSPKLVIQITGETKAPKANPNKKNSPKQEPTGDISKEDMMRAILEAEIGRLQVIRAHGLGDTLAILEGRITGYAERILELLENEAVDPTSHAHIGPHGSASFTTRRVTRLDVELLKENYPEVAERCLIPTITKGHLTATLRDSGADPATAQNILRQVFRRTDTLGPARVQISPNYGLFYKGLELDPEVEASGDDGDFDEPI